MADDTRGRILLVGELILVVVKARQAVIIVIGKLRSHSDGAKRQEMHSASPVPARALR